MSAGRYYERTFKKRPCTLLKKFIVYLDVKSTFDSYKIKKKISIDKKSIEDHWEVSEGSEVASTIKEDETVRKDLTLKSSFMSGYREK